MITRFSPGSHKLLVWEQGLGLLDDSVTDQQAEVVWQAMREEADLGAFLQVLMESTGKGLLTIPPFAVAIRSSRGMHVAVRGPFQLSVVTESEVVSLAGENVTTWEEKLLPGVVSVELIAQGGGTRRLPIALGIAEADWVGWGSTVPEASVSQPQVAGDDSPGPVGNEAAHGEPEAFGASEAEPEPPAQNEHQGVATSPVGAPSPARPRRGEADEVATLAPESTMSGGKSEEAADSSEELPRSGGVYAYLFNDDTAAPDLEAAAIRELPEADSKESAQPESSPMHDGLTVLGDEDEELPVALPPAPGQQVLAAACERGHPNPPQRGECFVCGAKVVGEARMVPRPQLGWLHISGGERVPLRGPIVAGRNPKSVAISTAEPPRLVALPHRHVSSNHLAFLLEGWTVLVRDLGSSNGSYLRRHNKPPVRLPEHDTPLIPGDVIDLGHGVFISLDRTP